jgi:histidyl-tRNA synthetase
MKEADRREIPFTMIVGENEIKENKFAFKNMQTGNQDFLSIEEIIKKF